MDGESGELTVRKCGRRMNMQVRDRGTGMRLMERTRTTRYYFLHVLQPTLRYLSTNQLTTFTTVCYNGEVVVVVYAFKSHNWPSKQRHHCLHSVVWTSH